MADADNFDSLTNNELRIQMVAQGLPNIPVTDSSRKVLVKRLRASLGGNASPTVSSPKKAANRRETLQPAVAIATADKVDATSAPTKARRTIASSLNETKEIERRRPEAAAPKAAPIESRRISGATERREVKKPDLVAEKPAAPKRRSPVNVLDNSLIILESDEEEDEELAQAVQNAEDLHKQKQKEVPQSKLPTKQPTMEQQPQRRPQIYEPPSVSEVPRPRELPKPRPTQLPSRTQAPPSFSQASGFNQPPIRSQASTTSSSSYSRYSSYVSQQLPSTSYKPSMTSAAPAAVPSSSAYPRTYANEFSDDTAEEDAQESAKSARFESDFARKLASLRAERIGDRSSPYNRRTIAGGTTGLSSSGYEPVKRRSLRPENVSLSTQFRQLCQSIERKYHVKFWFILIVLVLIFVAYKLYY